MVQPLQVGDDVYVSIRPGKRDSRCSDPVSRPTTLLVTVDRVAYIGSDTRIMVQLGQDRLFDVGAKYPFDG